MIPWEKSTMIYEYIDVNWCLNPILLSNSPPPSMWLWNSALIVGLETKLSPLMAPPGHRGHPGSWSIVWMAVQYLTDILISSVSFIWATTQNKHYTRGRWIAQITYIWIWKVMEGQRHTNTHSYPRLAPSALCSWLCCSPGSELLTLTQNSTKGRAQEEWRWSQYLTGAFSMRASVLPTGESRRDWHSHFTDEDRKAPRITLLEEHAEAWRWNPNQRLIDIKPIIFSYTKRQGTCPGDNRGDALAENTDSAVRDGLLSKLLNLLTCPFWRPGWADSYKKIGPSHLMANLLLLIPGTVQGILHPGPKREIVILDSFPTPNPTCNLSLSLFHCVPFLNCFWSGLFLSRFNVLSIHLDHGNSLFTGAPGCTFITLHFIFPTEVRKHKGRPVTPC